MMNSPPKQKRRRYTDSSKLNFQVDQANYQTQKTEKSHNNDDNISYSLDPSSSQSCTVANTNILKGMIICLTGFSADTKAELHRMVTKLGGRYTRDLLTNQTTHLIAGRTDGEKFKYALKFKNIKIISQKWLESCHMKNKLLDTADFPISDNTESNSHDTQSRKRKVLHHRQTKLHWKEECEKLLSPGFLAHNALFSMCYFYLVGFDEDTLDIDETPNYAETKKVSENSGEGKKSLLQIIRRGMGTNLWNVHESITHVIVGDGLDTKLRHDVMSFCRHHPNSPVAVSPEWITTSAKMKCHQNPSLFPPSCNQKNPPKPMILKAAQLVNNELCKEQLFQGAIFKFAFQENSKKKDLNQNIFDPDQIEKLITSNGGMMLSKKIFSILQKNIKSRNASEKSTVVKSNRVCYIVNMGQNFVLNDFVQSDSLVSRVEKEGLCVFEQVTPIWIQACVSNKIEIQPRSYPMLFQFKWPPCRLPSSAKLKVSVSGFQNSERIGMKHMLLAIGAEFTENMRNTNTHLICKEAKGPKYHKAIEWGLHVVTAQWMYHIAQHGYHEANGCEKQFSISFSPRRVQLVSKTNNVT